MRPLLFVLAAALMTPVVAEAGFEVSSFKRESRSQGSLWGGGDALDGSVETCWMVDPEQANEGQWIELDVPVSTVSKLGMVVGWVKSDETFADYARVKKVKVEVFQTDLDGPKLLSEQKVSFEDKPEEQIVELEDVKITGEIFGGKVRVTILEVYPGKDYPSLAVSELLVHLDEFEAVSSISATSSDAEGHGGALMVDGNARSFWVSEGAARGESVSIEAPRYGIAALGIQSGPKAYARPKTIVVELGDARAKHVLEDTTAWQRIRLPSLIGYTGSGWGTVKITIADTYEGASAQAAISELKLFATSLEDF